MTTSLTRPSLEKPSNETRPEPDQHSELSATRHLCAGVYLDRSFRELVIRKVHNDSRRRVAPSYGFDLVPIVRHAWRAWLLEVALHTAILAVLTTSLVLHKTLAVVLMLCAFGVYQLLIIAIRDLAKYLSVRAANEATRWWDRPNRPSRYQERDDQEKRKRRCKVSFAGCAALVLTPFAVARSLDESLRAALPTAMVLTGVLLVCGALVGIVRQVQLNANQRAKSLRPTTLTRREEVIDKQQDHPSVIYRRPANKNSTDSLNLLLEPKESPSPFMGGGKLVNRWLPPTTVQLLRPDPANVLDLAQREHTTPPFQARELVHHLRSALEQLTTAAGSENLPGLRVRDRLYVAEPDVSPDRHLLAEDVDLPIRQIIDNPLTLAHHFLETSVPIAGGELVTTVLIRVSVKGRCLSLDVATCALTRTPEKFQVGDRYGEDGFSAVVRAAFRDLFKLPGNVLHVWQLVRAPVVLGGAWWAVRDRTHKPRRGVPVSPRLAIREEVADDWDSAQLDRTTIYDHMKIIEQRILKATVDFLKAHDVDTSEFERQATNIINSGVLNMGGTMTGDNVAMGNSAKLMASVAQDLTAAVREQSA